MKRWIKRAAGSSADRVSRLYDLFYPSEQVDPSRSEQLLQAYRAIPVDPKEQLESQWIKFRQQIREQILNHSPAAFLRRPPLAHVLGLGNSASALGSWRYLRRLTNWHRYKAVLKEDSIGAPLRFLYMPSSGGNQIHHTSHLAAFEEKTGTRVDNLGLIVEFGGGYGSFCRQVLRLGFRGKYVIFDLPELSGLQRYYLASLGFRVLERDAWTDPSAVGIVLINDTWELAAVVAELRKKFLPSLFVATWSLSEVPLTLREEVLAVVNDFDHFLIAYQPAFGSVQNNEFFSGMITASRRPAGWHHYPIPHNTTSHYLIR